MNLAISKINLQDVILFLATVLANCILGFSLIIYGLSPLKSVLFMSGIASLFMFFIYKRLKHEFWLKSYITVVFSYLISIMLSSLITIGPFFYIESIIYILMLVLTNKFCRHQYWLVLAIVFFFQVFGVTRILFMIQKNTFDSKQYLEFLAYLYTKMDFLTALELVLPLITCVITLFLLKLRNNQ